jgi:hypothetical protein
MHTKFYSEILKGRDHLGDLGIDRRITLKWILKKHVKGVDWIHLAQDRDQWLALVNTVIKLWVT